MPTFVGSRVAQCRLSLAVSGNRMSVDLPWGCGSDVDGDDLLNIKEELRINFTPILAAAMSQDVHFQSLYLRPLLPAQANPLTSPYVTVAGLIAQDSIPSNVAVVIKQVQAVAPSRHNGRIFFPGVSKTSTTDGLLDNAAIVGVWGDVATYLQSTFTRGGRVYTPVVVSRFDMGAPIAPVGYSIAQCVVVPELATQRRRTTELREGHA
jgi:hypothetical protein